MTQNGDDFFESQRRGVYLVLEALELNGFKSKESISIAWNVFMNIFREYHKKPSHENFTLMVQEFLKVCKEGWDEELS